MAGGVTTACFIGHLIGYCSRLNVSVHHNRECMPCEPHFNVPGDGAEVQEPCRVVFVAVVSDGVVVVMVEQDAPEI